MQNCESLQTSTANRFFFFFFLIAIAIFYFTCFSRTEPYTLQQNCDTAVANAPGVQKARAQDHDGLAGALLELRLDGAELAVDDVHHALDLARRHGPGARLLPQQVHHVGRELTAGL